MISNMQHTINDTVTISDIGLHSGEIITMKLIPAAENHGIIFIRSDITDGDNVIPALWNNVVDTKLCTVIGNKSGAVVGTIEHLMSALRGLGVDNLTIEIDGAEVPAMDGSAMPFVEAIEEVGLKTQSLPKRAIKVLKGISVENNGTYVHLTPDSKSSFAGEIEFEHGDIGYQRFETQLLNGNFKHDIASARTFGFFHEAQWLRSQGLGLGGSLDNAIILNDDGVMNSEGLRFENEFIRHKLLDAIGDLYLAGGQVLGLYDGIKAGHSMNNAILHELFSCDDNWEYIDLPISQTKSKQTLLEGDLVFA